MIRENTGVALTSVSALYVFPHCLFSRRRYAGVVTLWRRGLVGAGATAGALQRLKLGQALQLQLPPQPRLGLVLRLTLRLRLRLLRLWLLMWL